MTGIYMITNRVNGHRYIGLSVDIEKRWVDHKAPRSRARRRVLAKAFRKYGVEAFSLSVLEECAGELLSEREVFWIAKLKPEYNMNPGGLGNKGYKVSDEVRARLSVLAKAQWERKSEEEKRHQIEHNLCGPKTPQIPSTEQREKIRLKLTGRKLPKEHVEKIRAALKGKPRPNVHRWKMVACINPNGTTRMYYCSIVFAAQDFGISPSCIQGVLKGRRKHAGGCRWSYLEEVHA